MLDFEQRGRADTASELQHDACATHMRVMLNSNYCAFATSITLLWQQAFQAQTHTSFQAQTHTSFDLTSLTGLLTWRDPADMARKTHPKQQEVQQLKEFVLESDIPIGAMNVEFRNSFLVSNE